MYCSVPSWSHAKSNRYLFGYDYVVLAAIYWAKCATTRHQSPAATSFAVVAAYSKQRPLQYCCFHWRFVSGRLQFIVIIV